MQKRYIIFIAIIILFTGCTAIRSSKPKVLDEGIINANWTAFQFGPWLFEQKTPIYGLGTGIYGAAQNSCGVFISSWGYTFKGENNGFNCGIMTDVAPEAIFNGVSCDFIYWTNPFIRRDGINNGLAINVVSSGRHVNGIMLGLHCVMSNISGVCIAAQTDGDISGLQLGVLSFGTVHGMQCGVITSNRRRDFIRSSPTCLALGWLNLSNVQGIQVGLINDHWDHEASLQIGLLNHNEAGFLPWMPLINWSCSRDNSSQVEQFTSRTVIETIIIIAVNTNNQVWQT
ncbi:MAG: hypothetical protein AB7F40_05985 [Victivallaceae bacterium]|nr:hypothetical protein [Victivallaceae bacterium]